MKEKSWLQLVGDLSSIQISILSWRFSDLKEWFIQVIESLNKYLLLRLEPPLLTWTRYTWSISMLSSSVSCACRIKILSISILTLFAALSYQPVEGKLRSFLNGRRSSFNFQVCTTIILNQSKKVSSNFIKKRSSQKNKRTFHFLNNKYSHTTGREAVAVMSSWAVQLNLKFKRAITKIKLSLFKKIRNLN